MYLMTRASSLTAEKRPNKPLVLTASTPTKDHSPSLLRQGVRHRVVPLWSCVQAVIPEVSRRVLANPAKFLDLQHLNASTDRGVFWRTPGDGTIIKPANTRPGAVLRCALSGQSKATPSPRQKPSEIDADFSLGHR
jgi:hypothetical protein